MKYTIEGQAVYVLMTFMMHYVQNISSGELFNCDPNFDPTPAPRCDHYPWLDQYGIKVVLRLALENNFSAYAISIHYHANVA